MAVSSPRAIADFLFGWLILGTAGLGWISLIGLIGSVPAAQAQISPDATLGTESSRVTRSRVRGRDGNPRSGQEIQRIDGGAVRGESLFHSFSEFNIGVQESAYFSNPAGIQTILGRVTGNDISDIFGTLGVLGNADLFLINPNGFVFGETARLDMRGSFVASTADRFDFPDGSSFSAVEPESAPLLTVALTPGLQYGQNFVGDIENRADLAVNVGETLAIAGRTTYHSGSLTAPGGTVQLLGDRVNLVGTATIDVSEENGGGSAYIGGERYGQGILPTAQVVRVDPGVVIAANALTNGDGGEIVVWGDRSTDFQGTVEARGGSQGGNGGFAEVSGRQFLRFEGTADLSAPLGDLGTLLLDPENIIIIDGAGGANDGNITDDDQVQVGDAPGATFTLSETTLEDLSGDANIVLEASNDIILNDLTDNELLLASGDGTVTFTADADGNGIGDFTMRDREDSIRTEGRDITITGAVLTPGNIATEGGNLTMTASDRILLNEVSLNSGDFEGISFTEVAGEIALSATNNIEVNNSFITSEGGIGTDEAGSIQLTSQNGSIQISQSQLSSSISNSGFASGFAGDIILEANRGGIVVNAGTITSEFVSDEFSEFGGAGFIQLSARDNIRIVADSNISAGSFGVVDVDANDGNVDEGGTLGADEAGSIQLISSNGSIQISQSQLSSSISSSGFAGDIILEANRGGIVVNAGTITSDFVSNGFSGVGGAGFIQLSARDKIRIVSNSTISADSFGVVDFETSANDGNVAIRSTGGSIRINNSNISTDADGTSFAGRVNIVANRNLRILNGSEVRSDSNEGLAGTLNLRALGGDLLVDNSRISNESAGNQIGQNDDAQFPIIDMRAPQGDLTLRNDTRLVSTARAANGRASNTSLLAGGAIAIDNSRISNNAEGQSGQGGVITLNADLIDITNQSQIQSDASGRLGEGGNIEISARDMLTIENSVLRSNATNAQESGPAGQITLNAPRQVSISNSRIENNGNSSSEDDAEDFGDISIEARRGTVSFDRVEMTTTNIGSNFAGDIFIDARDSILIGNGSEIQSNGVFGRVFIGQRVSLFELEISDSEISTTNFPFPVGDAGSVDIEAEQIQLINSEITTNTFGDGAGGAISLRGQASITLDQSELVSEVSEFTQDQEGFAIEAIGNGGDIDIILPVTQGALVLSNASRISTNARNFVVDNLEGGNGGNILIVASFITAERLGNNDITANAFAGEGGTISITAPDGIVGLVELSRDELITALGTSEPLQLDPINLPTSDITAISQSGNALGGEVVVASPDTDPARGLTELPVAFEDTPTLTSACSALERGRTGDRSEFVITGRETLPRQPDDFEADSAPSIPWVIRNRPQPEQGESDSSRLESPSEWNADRDAELGVGLPGRSSYHPRRIIEAQGWQHDDQGRVVLVAANAQGSNMQDFVREPGLQQTHPQCGDRRSSPR
ncbi:MAG: filamentous hemagglutinin N-terminal domain-containing protein [Elainellaceae cyanobacterium]